MLLGLGHRDAENAILEIGSYTVLLNAGGEAEAASEFADAALREPILGLVDGLLLSRGSLLRVMGDDLLLAFAGLRLGLVLNSRLMRMAALLSAALGDGTAHSGVLEMAAVGRSAGRVVALDSAADEHGLGLGELDANILLGHTRELAMELIGVGGLADVKLGLPGWESGTSPMGLTLSLARVAVKVIEEAEERREGGVGGLLVVEGSREEGHCVDFWLGMVGLKVVRLLMRESLGWKRGLRICRCL